MAKTIRSFLKTAIGVLLLVVLPLGLGYWLSVELIPTPKIAIIQIQGDIWGTYTGYLSQALERAGQDPSIHAVVLDITSPGGEVSASEGIYYDVLKLRQQKPVFVSIDEMAASGAYYIAVAADRIYAKPGSMVGNIGVISVLPADGLLDEQLITTGPFKLSGGTQAAYVRRMDLLKQTFLQAILAQRADRLQVGPEVLSRGEIYLGVQAQQMGLIDSLGSQAEAVAAAAELAGLRHYQVVDRTPELPEDWYWYGVIPNPPDPQTAATVAAPPKDLAPGLYYRYLEPLP